MRVDYLGLEAFVAIADLGSFNKAAMQMNLSQTALSHRIRKIEDDLGVQLLVRSPRDVSLTKIGQALLPQLREHLDHLSRLYGDLRSEGRKRQERVSLACLPTIATTCLPPVLRAFAERNPALVVDIHDRPTARIPELVHAGDVEFGITIMGAGQWDLEVEVITQEPYILLVHRDHRLAARGSVSRADLEGEAFVRIRTQSANRELVYDALGSWRERMVWRYEVQNAATAMSLVVAGAAVTVLPESAARLGGRDIVGLRFSDVRMSRPLAVVTRRGVPLSDGAQELLDMIRDSLPGRAERAA